MSELAILDNDIVLENENISENKTGFTKISKKKRDELIRENWDSIYKTLFYKLAGSWMSKITKDLHELTIEGMSYICDEMDNFDESKSTFSQWAISRCHYRLIDKYRIRHRSQNLYGLISKAYDEINKEGNKVTDERILEKLIVELGDKKGARDAIDKYKSCLPLYLEDNLIDEFGNSSRIEIGVLDKSYAEVDWNDTKQEFIRKVNKAFEEKRINRLQKLALTENIIPKIEGNEFKTFRDIASEYGFSEPYVVQQLKYKNFLKVMKEICSEVGLYIKEKE